MRMPSLKQRRSLEKACTTYEGSLTAAIPYLEARGIDETTAKEHRLGVVTSPEPGHEQATGRLCIPYMNKAGVIGLKFRCMQAHDCKQSGCQKYLSLPGQEIYLYNVAAVDTDSPIIHIAEGELDAIVLSRVLNQPAIGVPGSAAWREHHPWHFRGFTAVLIWGDGDKAGADFARAVRKKITAAEIIPMPPGHDVNSLLLEAGADAIKKLAGQDDTEQDCTHG